MAVMAKFLRSIVRNDAMREDPDEIYGWRVFALACAACFGGMLFGWDTGAIGGILAMPTAQERFGYYGKDDKAKADQDQNIVSTLQAGCFVACFFTGWAADKFGRRLCLIGTGVLTVIGVVFQASSAAKGTLAVMFIGRFIAGLGCGAASTLTPLYVSECAPRAIRGGLTGKLNYTGCQRRHAAYIPPSSFLPALHRVWHHGCLLVSSQDIAFSLRFAS